MPALLNDINRLNMNKNMTKVQYMKNRIVELGGYQKKKFLKFKEGLKRIEEKKELKTFEREHQINKALLKKRSSRRRKCFNR
ncbi:hypothetical protein M153_1640004133 [Pseudoloma neurophilia]|uniref:Uncharacterized protein n=1 Tax=Pseudoloma neurophilia TaxID=146866 RepID=A0A0R0LZL9_9MICR|nr:hypothetical protein M153_1640004133 [Pseudoloma neurophilia]